MLYNRKAPPFAYMYLGFVLATRSIDYGHKAPLYHVIVYLSFMSIAFPNDVSYIFFLLLLFVLSYTSCFFKVSMTKNQ